jgi:hypothetical protein
MGMKSRTNWNLNTCLKEDCVNRGLCDFCVKYDLYLAQEAFDAVSKVELPSSPESGKSPLKTPQIARES